MATLAVVARAAPEIASVASRLWPGPFALDGGREVPAGEHAFSIAYLATVRRDGAPRLHPFCPIVAHGRLFAAIARRSPKGWDLRRDPRLRHPCAAGPRRRRAVHPRHGDGRVRRCDHDVARAGGRRAQRRRRHDRVSPPRARLRVRHPAGRRRELGRRRPTGNARRATTLAPEGVTHIGAMRSVSGCGRRPRGSRARRRRSRGRSAVPSRRAR